MSVLIRTTWHILAWLQTYGNSIIVRETEKEEKVKVTERERKWEKKEQSKNKDCGNLLSLLRRLGQK